MYLFSYPDHIVGRIEGRLGSSSLLRHRVIRMKRMLRDWASWVNTNVGQWGGAGVVSVAARPRQTRGVGGPWKRHARGVDLFREEMDEEGGASPGPPGSSGVSRTYSSFSIPLQRRTRTPEESPCFWCRGTSTVPCAACRGTGNASTGKNHHARNHVNLSRVVGTKWTALERTFGWRHFEVKEYMHVLKADPRKKNGKQTYVLLEATCDASVRLWVDIEILKSRQIWSAGWLQKETLQKLLAEEEHGGGNRDLSSPCQACGGRKVAPCRYCCSPEPISLF